MLHESWRAAARARSAERCLPARTAASSRWATPLLYSTYVYLLRELRVLEPRRGSSPCRASRPWRLSRSSPSARQDRRIVPAADDLDGRGAVVSWRIGRRLQNVLDELIGLGLTDRACWLPARHGTSGRDQLGPPAGMAGRWALYGAVGSCETASGTGDCPDFRAATRSRSPKMGLSPWLTRGQTSENLFCGPRPGRPRTALYQGPAAAPPVSSGCVYAGSAPRGTAVALCRRTPAAGIWPA